MQQLITTPQIREVYEQDNKYYAKTFLLDSTLARNGMRVIEEYIPKNIHKFVGRPVLLTPDLNHPHEFEHFEESKDYQRDVPELLKLQEPYKIGNIVDVSTNTSIQQGGGTNYSALLEITDPKAIAAFRAGKIPLYVSPSIYRVNSADPVYNITDYEPLHIAIVDNPAYGFHKANIRQTCQGNKNECQRMLAQASNPDLAYCVEKTLNGLKNVLQGNSSLVQNTTQKENVNMVSEENTNNSVETKVEETTAPQQVETQPEQSQEQKTPINTAITGSPSLEPNETEQEEQKEEVKEAPKAEQVAEESPCEKAAREFEERISTYDKKLKELEKFKSSYEKQAEETKVQTKRSKIENVIPGNYADSEEERAKAIENFMKVPDEQLEYILNNFVTPARNVRQGSLSRRPKVTDFVKNTGESRNVTQASLTTRIDELDRIFKFTGIVPKSRNEGGIM